MYVRTIPIKVSDFPKELGDYQEKQNKISKIVWNLFACYLLYFNIQLATLFSKTVPLHISINLLWEFSSLETSYTHSTNKIFLIRTKIKETKELDKEFIDKTRLLQIAKLQ